MPWKFKPCPFCGKEPEMYNPDTLYPNGIGWKYVDEDLRVYVHMFDVPHEQWCYSVYCVETAGGCGVEVSGDSEEEAVRAWNRRDNKEE